MCGKFGRFWRRGYVRTAQNPDPALSVGIISCCSGLIIYASMQIGVLMSRFVHPEVAKMIGAFILMGIGIWAIYQMFTQKKEDPGSEPEAQESAEQPKPSPSAKEILYIELKRFGLVIQILRTPSIADMDRSGNISPYEAMLLGLALSLDAFGAGIGVCAPRLYSMADRIGHCAGQRYVPCHRFACRTALRRAEMDS
ncbi:hypothetical protein LJK87_03290 [Paenibacillus sp. P25]|nr:hypothetical protein LJK87_03290 [Paenibacillus sp. P25]